MPIITNTFIFCYNKFSKQLVFYLLGILRHFISPFSTYFSL